MAPRAWLAATLGLLALLVTAGPALAHNPAHTVYEPAPFHGDLLAIGEEGTAARVTLDGEATWRANRSIHVTQAPVVSGGVAVVAARTVPNATPIVQAFDAERPTWQTSLGEAGSFAYVAAASDGFLAVSTEGHLASLAPDGTVRAETDLDVGARTAPVPAPDGGWVIAGPDRQLAIVTTDGEELHRTGLGGTPSDLATHDGAIYATFYGEPRGTATVQVLEGDLTTRWIQNIDGLRVGGELALLDDGALAVGTFDPRGARILVLDADGDERWNRSLEGRTAAAVTAHEGRLFAAANDQVYAFTVDGEPLWNATASPRIASPTVHQDLVLASGAGNELAALDAEDGSRVWTFSDGVDTVPWTDEQLSRAAPGGEDARDPDDAGSDANPSPVPWALPLAGLAIAAIVANVRADR